MQAYDLYKMQPHKYDRLMLFLIVALSITVSLWLIVSGFYMLLRATSITNAVNSMETEIGDSLVDLELANDGSLLYNHREVVLAEDAVRVIVPQGSGFKGAIYHSDETDEDVLYFFTDEISYRGILDIMAYFMVVSLIWVVVWVFSIIRYKKLAKTKLAIGLFLSGYIGWCVGYVTYFLCGIPVIGLFFAIINAVILVGAFLRRLRLGSKE